MFCKMCGNQVADGAMFCPACGTRLTSRTPSNNQGVDGQNGVPNNVDQYTNTNSLMESEGSTTVLTSGEPYYTGAVEQPEVIPQRQGMQFPQLMPPGAAPEQTYLPVPMYPMQGQGYPIQPMQGQGYPMQSMQGQGYPMQPMQGQGYPMQPMPGQGYPMQPVQGQGYPMQPMQGQGYPMQPAQVQGYIPQPPQPSQSQQPTDPAQVQGYIPQPTQPPQGQMIPQSELPTTRVTVGDYTGSLTSETPTRKFAEDGTQTKKERKQEEKEQKKLDKENKKKYRVKKSKKKLALKISIAAVFLIGVGIGAFFGIRYLINKSNDKYEVRFDKPDRQNIVVVEGERPYVKSELIIQGKENCTKKKVQKLIEEKKAEIVGIISPVKYYQIRFKENMEKSALEQIRDEWSKSEIVAEVDLHYAYLTEGGFSDFKKDVWWNDNDGEMPEGFEEQWDIFNPKGNNWAVESVWAPAVWNPSEFDLSAYGTIKDVEYKQVKVGLLDTTFDRKHKDLTNRFKDTAQSADEDDKEKEDDDSTEASTESKPERDVASEYAPYAGKYNDKNLTDTEKAEEKRLSHGTHVAGIIGANMGDNFGIAGVAQNSELYAYDLTGDYEYSFTFEWEAELAKAFHDDVKLINVSMHLDLSDTGDAKANMAKINAELAAFLKHYREDEDDKHDFLLVKSAGDSDSPKDDLSDEFLCGITDQELKDRILVVGGAKPNYDEYEVLVKDKEYVKKKTTNYGDRIDIYAPAVNVLSDIPGDRVEMRDGTSAATAFVTSGCALVMGAAPDLSMPEVKKIVCNNYLYTVDGTGKGYLNVFLATEEAKLRAESSDGEESKEIEGGSDTDTGVSAKIGEKLDGLRKEAEEQKKADKGILKLQLSGAFMKEVPKFESIKVVAKNGTEVKKLKFNKKGAVSFAATPGEWKVELSYNGYEKESLSLTIQEGKTETAKNVALKKIAGFAELKLASGFVSDLDDPGKVTVKATAKGKKAVTESFKADGTLKLELVPGSWTIEVSCDEYLPENYTLDIKSRKTVKQEDIELKKPFSYGKLISYLGYGEISTATLSYPNRRIYSGDAYGTDVLTLDSDGNISGTITTNDGKTISYTGKFSPLKTIKDVHRSKPTTNPMDSGEIHEASYSVVLDDISTDEHPVLKKGTSYIFNFQEVTDYGGHTVLSIQDGDGNETGYAFAEGNGF